MSYIAQMFVMMRTTGGVELCSHQNITCMKIIIIITNLHYFILMLRLRVMIHKLKYPMCIYCGLK